MAGNKYYWLRIKRDFFKRHDIRIVESMPNGKDHILFYLKLLCESVDHEGNLRFSENIPYDANMLATITNTNIDTVKAAIQIFTDLNMMEIMEDGTLYMTEVEKMIGACTQDEHTRESTRLRVARYRERQKQALLEEPKNTQKNKNRYSNATCNGEIELEIEKELYLNDISKDISFVKTPPIPYKEIVDEYNSICAGLPKVTIISDKRKKAIKSLCENKDIGRSGISMAFSRAMESDFLKGDNKSGWKANFDWILKPANIVKILEGNYDNKTGKNQYQAFAEWAGEEK